MPAIARLAAVLMAAVVLLFFVAVADKVCRDMTKPLYPLYDQEGRRIPE